MYDKGAALAQDAQSGRKLQRVGEAVLEGGVWRVNDEMVRQVRVIYFIAHFMCCVQVSRRQTHERAAFFHFRHWDDYIRARYVGLFY